MHVGEKEMDDTTMQDIDTGVEHTTVGGGHSTLSSFEAAVGHAFPIFVKLREESAVGMEKPRRRYQGNIYLERSARNKAIADLPLTDELAALVATCDDLVFAYCLRNLHSMRKEGDTHRGASIVSSNLPVAQGPVATRFAPIGSPSRNPNGKRKHGSE